MITLVTYEEDGHNLSIAPHQIKVWYRQFIQKGFSPEESANLVASLMGLRKEKKNWTLRELQHLDFLKHHAL